MRDKIDLDRCRRGMRNIEVKGAIWNDSTARLKAIEAAIIEIAKNPKSSLFSKFIGVKVYAGFGDQRWDCEYGRGPKHGDIRFSIGRTHENRTTITPLGDDEIYLLECVRDFGSVDDPLDNKGPHRPRRINLCEAIETYDKLTGWTKQIELAFSTRYVESHERA